MKDGKKFVASYKLIKEDIIADILSGIYEKGDKIQGQNYYADKFQVSRTTVRNAIYDLIDRGVLETVQGKGTYVKGLKAAKQSGGEGKTNDTFPIRLTPSSGFYVVAVVNDIADHRVAKQLNVPVGAEIIRLERVRMVDKIAGNYQISYLDKKLVKGIDFLKEDLETQGSLYRLLIHKTQRRPSYSDEMIRAVACPEPIAKYFYINRHEPILLISRVIYGTDGVVMEYCLDYECTDVNGLRIRDEKGWLDLERI